MNFHQIAGIIAGVVAAASFVEYIKSILRGETKPARVTFLIWLVIDTLLLASYFSSGARETIWIAVVYSLFMLIIFILSLKQGVGGFNKFDISVFLLAVAGIVMWAVTKDPVTALYIYLFVEFLGFLPVYKKSYLQPETENLLSWKLALTAGFINLLAVNELKLEIIIYPIFFIICDSAIVFLLIWRGNKKKQLPSAI